MVSFLLDYPSRRLGISSPHNVRCISSAPLGLYLITRQRAFSLRLDFIYQNCFLFVFLFEKRKTKKQINC